MISLLTKIGGAVKGALGATKLTDIFGMLGDLTSTVGKYQTSQFGMDAMEHGDAINRAYKEQLMSRRVRDMVGGATEAYGKGLLSSVRAGGTMPSFTSPIWQSVRDGMEDYGADLRAMALNSKIRQASFAAQQGANRMAMLSSMVNGILNSYNDISSRVSKGSSDSPAVSKEYLGSKFSLPGKKRKGGQ